MTTNTAGVQIAGDVLREWRKLGGYDLVTFAAKAEISFGYLGQIERGTRPTVGPAVFVRICDALGLAKKDRTQLLKKTRAKKTRATA
jgi:transcriptional regulator with XRE-family HTH domain